MGKAKSTAWQHYTNFHREKIIYEKFNFCDTSFQQNATRMTEHLLKKCLLSCLIACPPALRRFVQRMKLNEIFRLDEKEIILS
jgi:hypothetical protein